MPRLSRSITSLAFVAAIAVLAGAQGLMAQTPEASPEVPILPDGPLGEQIQWVIDLLNGDPADITVEEIDAHLTPEFLAEVPADEIVDGLSQVAGSGPFIIEDNMIITTMDLPATNGWLVLVGDDAVRIEVSIQIDRDSGLITGLLVEPASGATPGASPVASPAT
jgi:hypothetical protein